MLTTWQPSQNGTFLGNAFRNSSPQEKEGVSWLRHLNAGGAELFGLSPPRGCGAEFLGTVTLPSILVSLPQGGWVATLCSADQHLCSSFRPMPAEF